MTYDDWKTTDDTPELEPLDLCPVCRAECVCPGCHGQTYCWCKDGEAQGTSGSSVVATGLVPLWNSKTDSEYYGQIAINWMFAIGPIEYNADAAAYWAEVAARAAFREDPGLRGNR